MSGTYDLLGRQIDQYRILEHIARGGMADVYLAEDVDLERKVALKVMLDALAASDPQFAERFRREAKTVARLDHPNIVQVYTVGQTPAGQPYIAMQYIEGGSLQEKLAELADRRKLLTTEQALNIVRQIALALGAAHKAGIVHRDLKPANVLVRPDGTPVLVDLGIAAIQGGARLTQTGGVIGTPAYMSPEQVRGRPLDGRSDLYALGIMLYEILAGMRPFDADESVAILHKQVYEEPLPLDHIRSDLSPQTLTLVEIALQKDPGHRYQTAEEMVQAIDRAIQAEGLSGPNPAATIVLTQMNDSKLLRRSQIVQAPTAVPKKRPAYLWPAVILLVLLLTAIAFFAFRAAAGPPPVIGDGAIATPAALIIPTEPAVTAPPVSPTTAPSATPTTPPTATPMTPTETPTAVPPTPTPLPEISGGLPGFGPNQILYAANDTGYWGLYMLDSSSGQEIALLSDNANDNSAPVWSPDGTQVAFHSQRGGNWDIYLLDIASGDVRRLTSHEKGDLFPTWSPDGRQLAFHSTRNGNYDLFRIDIDTLALQPLTDSLSLEASPNWSPDGAQLVFEANYTGSSGVYLLNLSDLSVEALVDTPANETNPAWSPDGRQVVYSSDEGGGDYNLFVINADGAAARQLTTNDGNDLSPSWSPDGRQIVYESWQDSSVLYVIDADGSNPRALANSPYKQRFPDWLGNPN